MFLPLGAMAIPPEKTVCAEEDDLIHKVLITKKSKGSITYEDDIDYYALKDFSITLIERRTVGAKGDDGDHYACKDLFLYK